LGELKELDDLVLSPKDKVSSDTARCMVGSCSDEVDDPPPCEEFVAIAGPSASSSAGPGASSSFLSWLIFLFLVFFILTQP
jgi:hypothetical protein